MLTMVFVILMFLIFGKLIVFGLKAAWGISKIVCTVLLLPLCLVGLVIIGLIKIALPLLLIVGIVSLVLPKSRC
ncbi:MAG: hypothetical protein Q4E91_03045 [Lachnospiraceae bacterium]|nr:hypothetical protein [Lachnospiraceae bacterium]